MSAAQSPHPPHAGTIPKPEAAMMKVPASSVGIQDAYPAKAIRMGHLPVMQPFPLPRLEQLSPCLLLHHFGPRKVLPGVDPLGIEAHPHRGFEPVTFLFQGEIEHRDSRGNEGVLKPGSVQWMTAGRGIVHSEKASKAFVDNGGTLEGIQLWVNLPSAHKMVQPAYQDFNADQLGALSGEGWRMALVSGWHRVLNGTANGTARDEGGSTDQTATSEWTLGRGPAHTHTPVETAMVYTDAQAGWRIGVPEGHQAGLYVLDGRVRLNGETQLEKYGFARLGQNGGVLQLEAEPGLRALWMAGAPIDEPVVSHGPFVMNSQTEILEAMRDYQMGKMGMLLPK